MAAALCAGCATKIEGSDVYYRPEDGAPVCQLCLMGIDRVRLEMARAAQAAAAKKLASQKCMACAGPIEGTGLHRPSDNLIVCASCFLQNGGYHVVLEDPLLPGRKRPGITPQGYAILADTLADDDDDDDDDDDYGSDD